MKSTICFTFAAVLLVSLGTAQDSAKKPDDVKKWDVANPPGPRSEIPLDVNRGTWMSVDVSPDGREIVFDLLGDLYVIPIGGGEAKALTTGMAWDMQPRYSPDGKRIAFTSDRGGGDNIWVINRDGSNPKQVTKEDFRLLNSPAWSPDGQYIAARKHFTAQRSLGAGEIWLYHFSGGAGLQMTKKPNDQKDAGEPAFSPDGKYVYFSQDTTAGPLFEYNKDPNKNIYSIRRFDRETGDADVFLASPGGNVRPAPSPDGKQLAFVRRVRTRTALYTMDLASGVERELFDGLDRDMQETWAIHGVYPQMAWTPDNRSIVFWADGRIQRIDVATKEVRDIPFHVKSSRTVTDAVRFPVAVAPDKFDVKMLRWAQVSPQGDKVVYQALGHLYIRALPEGQPKRLTAQSDHWELAPSFSRDGRSIVYTTWNDDSLGTIRVAPASGGEGKVISGEPGFYLDPCFSPDGGRVVYRRVRGGFITSAHWSQETGLYVMPASGGPSRRLNKTGQNPHFGASIDRVFFNDGENGKSVLRVIRLDASEARTLVISEDASEMRVSPDERWIAFTELFNAYIAPFAPTGQPIALGPKSTAIPIRKVTRDAGEYLHWSGDSKALHWTLGPELYTRDLKEAFTFVEGANEALPGPPETGRNIAFSMPSDKPAGKLAFVGARLVTMRGDEVIEDGAVVVAGNRIAAVGPRSSVAIPSDAKVIDLAGKTMIPGLVDVHAHGPYAENDVVPQRNWALYAAAAFGVTTVHDPSSDTDTVFAASEMRKAGMITGPRIFSTGTILYGAGLPIRAEVNSLDDARSHLRRMKAAGAFSVKSYNQPRRDQRQQIIAAARELGMMVVPEGGSLYQHNMTMVVDGHTGVEHAVPVARLYEDVLQLWPKTKTWYTPTLGVAYGGLWGENYWYQHTEVWNNERLLRFVPRDVVDPRSRRRVMAPEDDFNHIAIARAVKQLMDRGLHIQLGAHGQLQGMAPHWELWMFVQGGMTPHEALRAGTLAGAQYLGMDADIGSIEPGKLADLAVIEGNPLQDIRQSEHVRYTVINGRLYESDSMNESGNHPSQRGKFPFE